MDTNNTERKTGVIGVWDWVGTLVLLSIPFVNIIAIIYYLVNKNTHPTKRNYVLAMLVIILIFFVLGMVFGATLSSLLPTQGL